MARAGIDLGDGVRQFQSPLWQTNCLLAVAGGEALLCDPSYTQDELEELVDEVRAAGAERVHVLVTHADYDHVCGLAAFPEATVVADQATAARIEDGAAQAGLSAAATEWGIDWPLDGLRVDHAVAAGEVQLGSFRVTVVDAPSHGREGACFVLLDQGVLFPGDHLSPITIPLIGGSLESAIQANRALLEALDAHDLRCVVPGHGRALTPEEAREIGEADLAYLERLRDAAGEASTRDLAPGWALLHAYAVEPPRADTDDFAVYGIRTGNARLALTEAAEVAA
jgi:glyoxylase-like metal-dependent hydrolase (beta-lactamase superfamily II)